MKYHKIIMMMMIIIIIIIIMKRDINLNNFKCGVPKKAKTAFLTLKNKSATIFSKYQALQFKILATDS